MGFSGLWTIYARPSVNVIVNFKFVKRHFLIAKRRHQLIIMHERYVMSEGLSRDAKGRLESDCQRDQIEEEELLRRIR